MGCFKAFVEREAIEVDVIDNHRGNVDGKESTNRNGAINENSHSVDGMTTSLTEVMESKMREPDIASVSNEIMMIDKKDFRQEAESAGEMPLGSFLEKVQFDELDEGIPDEDDIFNRFYFESDHLALKDNAE